MKPPLTVLVLARNAANYLRFAVDSALAQSAGDFELLIVYDESSDGTMNLISDLQRADRRIRWVQGTNEGLSAARAVGIRESQGNRIALLDSDDLWEPDKLRIQLDFLKDNADLVATSTWGWYIGPRGLRAGVHSLGPVSREEYQKRRAQGVGFVMLTSSVILDRRVALGCVEPRRSIDAVEDALLFARMGAAGPIVTLPQRLASYRVHPTGVSANQLARQRMLLRWIDHNLARELKGLSWESEFAFQAAQERRGWWTRANSARRDRGAVLYRTGAAHLADRHLIRGLVSLVPAAVLSPGYVIRKLRNQAMKFLRSGGST